MRAPDSCITMAELRDAIDALDENLISLLARRAEYIDRAVTLKTHEGLPARIGTRVEEVVAHVRRAARGQGLDPALAEHLWRELIEWSIAREARSLDET